MSNEVLVGRGGASVVGSVGPMDTGGALVDTVVRLSGGGSRGEGER